LAVFAAPKFEKIAASECILNQNEKNKARIFENMIVSGMATQGAALSPEQVTALQAWECLPESQKLEWAATLPRAPALGFCGFRL
jgi:hypothetical protein